MNTNENGETSMSTSSSSMEMSRGQALTIDNKSTGGNSNKTMKRDESLNPCEAGVGQSQESSVEESLIDNLPPEMLTKILKYVNTLSLFKCRLVNRKWNEMSSGILRNRSNAKSRFDYTVKYGFSWRTFRPFPREKRSLEDFLKCITNSKDSPFSQFSFNNNEMWNPLTFFNDKDFNSFTSYFACSNQRLKCIELRFHFVSDIKMVTTFTNFFRDLLLNKIPQLEELTLDLYASAKAPYVKLFPTSKKTKSETTSNQVSDAVPVQVQLPNLKVLHTETSMISSYTEMFKDLLNAAVNLKCLYMQIYSPEDFQFLHSMGKLHLLKKATIEIDPDLFNIHKRDKKCVPLPFPKLESLDLTMITFEDEKDAIFWSQGEKFLGNLFESSKDTLTELKTHPIGLFTGLQLPTFTKLRKLEITESEISPLKIFPPGIRSRDVFPAVSELELDMDLLFSDFPEEKPEDSIPVFPRVKVLRLNDSKLKEHSISILALMCPNLIKLQIHRNKDVEHEFDHPPFLNLLKIGRAIWTHMKQLESLEIDVNVESNDNNYLALDSCFTGISLENCEHLGEMMNAKKKLESYGVSVEIPESKLQALAKREFPSILDMKNLKTLTIHPYWHKTLLKRMNFFTEKLTWISEEFAFKFLLHLKPKPEEEG